MRAQRAATGAALRPFPGPSRQQVRLKNGLTVHLSPRGPLPLIALRFVVRAGSALDPQGREGLADFTARLMRRGAGGLSADALNEATDFVGASISAGVGEDLFVVSLQTPTRHFDQMLELFAKVLTAPDFAQKELELARRRTLAQLANALDDPSALADRALVHQLYAGHPYGHETYGGARSLERFERAELQAFHQGRVGPGIGHLFVVGDVEPDAVVKKLEGALGGWRGGPDNEPVPLPLGPLQNAGTVLLVDKPDQTQAQVRIAGPGLRRGHPDHHALQVMNSSLGGGFTSRLVREIRVKRGLSYGASSYFEMLQAGGSFQFSSFTKTATVPQLIALALGEVARMKAKGPTELEVETARRYLAGLYPARLETNEAIAQGLTDVVLFGLGDRWIPTFRDRVMAVTRKEAARVAAQWLPDAGLVMVVVGNAKALEAPLARYGKVTVVQPSLLA